MGNPPGSGGGSMPPGVLESLEAQLAALPASSGPTDIVASGTGIAGGVTAMPIDASSALQVTIPAYVGWASVPASVNFTVCWRILNPDGTITNGQYAIQFMPSVGSSKSFLLSPGYLLSVAVTCQTPNVVTGLFFVVVGLIHQLSGSQPLDMALIAAYLTSTNPLGWPYGVLHELSDGMGAPWYYNGGSPAAGTTFSLATTSALTQLLGVSFIYNGGSATTPPAPYITANMGTQTGMTIASCVVNLNKSQAWSLCAGVGQSGANSGMDGIIPMAMQDLSLVPAGTNYTIKAVSMSGTDQLQNILLWGRSWS